MRWKRGEQLGVVRGILLPNRRVLRIAVKLHLVEALTGGGETRVNRLAMETGFAVSVDDDGVCDPGDEEEKAVQMKKKSTRLTKGFNA